MPPLPPVPNVLKITNAGVCAGQNIINIWHANYSGGTPTDAILNTFAALVANKWQEHFQDLMDSNYTYGTVVVQDLTSDTAPVGNETVEWGGGSSGTQLSNQVCALINHTIARRYRGGKPRTYIGAVPQSFALDPRTLTGSAISDYLSAWNEFATDVAAFTSGDFTIGNLGCVSYYDKALNPTPPYRRTDPIFFPFGSSSVNERLCTQRRRLGKSVGG